MAPFSSICFGNKLEGILTEYLRKPAPICRSKTNRQRTVEGQNRKRYLPVNVLESDTDCHIPLIGPIRLEITIVKSADVDIQKDLHDPLSGFKQYALCPGL